VHLVSCAGNHKPRERPPRNSHEATELSLCRGATARSPDGRVYQVGDEGNLCGSVACDGGIQGACPGGETEGAFRKVICAPAKQHSATSRNIVIQNDETVGVWGGTCTCPDGEVYLVGQRRAACAKPDATSF
jgi:hypothetical protein